jgi:hypothetical protein
MRDELFVRRLSDTTLDAERVQRAVYHRLGGRERLAIAFRLNETVRRMAMSGIRSRHPEYSDRQVQRAFARLRLGDALVRQVWPNQPLVDP